MNCETHKTVMKFLPAQFLCIDKYVFEAILSIKDFQSDQIRRSSHKISTALYACRNADLNVTLVMGTTRGFIFQIINSLTESWRVPVCLTCLDCIK